MGTGEIAHHPGKPQALEERAHRAGGGSVAGLVLGHRSEASEDQATTGGFGPRPRIAPVLCIEHSHAPRGPQERLRWLWGGAMLLASEAHPSRGPWDGGREYPSFYVPAPFVGGYCPLPVCFCACFFAFWSSCPIPFLAFCPSS